jgi:hypothetical protein
MLLSYLLGLPTGSVQNLYIFLYLPIHTPCQASLMQDVTIINYGSIWEWSAVSSVILCQDIFLFFLLIFKIVYFKWSTTELFSGNLTYGPSVFGGGDNCKCFYTNLLLTVCQKSVQ